MENSLSFKLVMLATISSNIMHPSLWLGPSKEKWRTISPCSSAKEVKKSSWGEQNLKYEF